MSGLESKVQQLPLKCRLDKQIYKIPFVICRHKTHQPCIHYTLCFDIFPATSLFPLFVCVSMYLFHLVNTSIYLLFLSFMPHILQADNEEYSSFKVTYSYYAFITVTVPPFAAMTVAPMILFYKNRNIKVKQATPTTSTSRPCIGTI